MIFTDFSAQCRYFLYTWIPRAGFAWPQDFEKAAHGRRSTLPSSLAKKKPRRFLVLPRLQDFEVEASGGSEFTVYDYGFEVEGQRFAVFRN